MIFAELQYDQPYSDAHSSLVALLGQHFQSLESGLQGDSWIWILADGLKVSVDTFTSMHHQVKASQRSWLLDQVLAILANQYNLRMVDPPALEGHE